ncbi:TM0106 family RecB-like putative nuclease [Candidatus Peregrinibacteria bacterium]|jgi:predicted RecB family nuclease|nr:TM0106 family RecB-like putative nuclease [Candidatus Peregrinibacteria bacterium]MBT4055608.1 TM0106 family RecB-like putative nuclease [Candidatus Peregrinibacteria bacterium]
MHITASQLYNYIQCPHRVWRDIYGPQDEKEKEANSFVELLWEKGVQHEEKIISRIGDFTDTSKGSLEERFEKTKEAMDNKTPLIYQGVIQHKNLLGIPDLLKKLPDGNYIAVDIKSGSGLEGVDEHEGKEGKFKKHYAAQLCLYTDILNKLGYSNIKVGRIIDIHGEEVDYDLMSPRGKKNPQTWWEFYEQIKKHVEFLMKNQYKNKPAMAGICKLCPWYKSCKKWCDETQDLTNIFYLGRSNRDVINDDLSINNIEEFLDLDIENIKKEKKKDKSYLKGLGETSLSKYLRRADILINTKEPVAYEPIVFPEVECELFFDIEDDPTQEFVYMHGVYERRGGKERYVHFTAEKVNDEEEKRVWGDFWEYIKSLPKDNFAVYYYSHHEKTTYRKLQEQYSDVISMEEVEEFFENPNVIDLYKIVLKETDFPLGSYSLKAIANYMGFKWRDESPSGALSIQWFNKYIETGDKSILKRILEYNEDDCKATMVLKDGLEKLQLINKN